MKFENTNSRVTATARRKLMRGMCRAGLSVGMVFLLTGCFDMMIYPPQDDLSVLKDDLFSRLVKETLFQDDNVPNSSPFTYFDQQQAIKLSQEFLGESQVSVTERFKREGGSCETVKRIKKKKYLYCEVSRQWRRTQRFGGFKVETSDTKKTLAIPGAKLKYTFELSMSDIITSIDITSIDIAFIRQKPNYHGPGYHRNEPYPVASKVEALRGQKERYEQYLKREKQRGKEYTCYEWSKSGQYEYWSCNKQQYYENLKTFDKGE